MTKKTVLITGGSKGIGQGTAKYCLDQGCRVVLLARNLQTLEQTRQEFVDDPRRLSEELWQIEKAGVDLIGQIPLGRLVDHIEHAATVAGIDHVGVGCDYDSVGLKVPKGLEHIGLTPNLVTALTNRGFSQNDVAKIMGGNVLRVMQETEDVAG